MLKKTTKNWESKRERNDIFFLFFGFGDGKVATETS